MMCWQEGVLGALVQDTASRVTEAAKSAYAEAQQTGSALKMDVLLQNPYVLLPELATTDGSSLHVDLGKIRLSNKLQRRERQGGNVVMDMMQIQMDAMHVTAMQLKMVEDINVNVLFVNVSRIARESMGL